MCERVVQSFLLCKLFSKASKAFFSVEIGTTFLESIHLGKPFFQRLFSTAQTEIISKLFEINENTIDVGLEMKT